MQLKAFVKMCVVFCWIWMYVCIYLQRSKGAKCLQTLHNISFSLGVCMCVWAIAGYLVRLSLLSRLLWSSQTSLVHWYCFSLFYTRLWLSQIFSPYAITRDFLVHRKVTMYIFEARFVHIFFHHSMHSMTDFIWLSACVGCWIELPVSWCLWQCYIVINVAELLTHCLGIYTIFFHLYHLNRDKSN